VGSGMLKLYYYGFALSYLSWSAALPKQNG
jgi:hypothetical protein